MKKIKVGVIGLGVGKKHIVGFQAHPQAEVVKICDIDTERLQEVEREYPRIDGANDPEEVLNDPNVDVVSIASYDNYHGEQILRALNNGKHVFVEKPLCIYEHEAEEIWRCLSEYPDLKLSSNLALRTCPRFIGIRDTVHSGKMGRMFYIEGDYLWGRVHKLMDGWRKDMEFYSIVYGAALHMIDLILWATGMRPVEVQAYGNKIATENTPLQYNSFAVILMKFKDGTVAKVTGNGGCAHPHFHRLAVFGTKKTAIHDVTGAKWLDIRGHDAEHSCMIEEYPAKEERSKVITTFVDSILDSNIHPVVPCNDVFDAMSVCFAAEKAMHGSSPVKVTYF